MADQQHHQPAGDLPAELASPARRALAAAGSPRLERLTPLSQAELGRLHGLGPKALDQLRGALAASGRSFADAERERHGRPQPPA